MSVAFTAPVSISELATIGTQVGIVSGLEDPNRDFIFSINDPSSTFEVGTTTCAQVAEGPRCQAAVTLKAALSYKTSPVKTVIMTATCTVNLLTSVTNLYVSVLDMSPTTDSPISASATIVQIQDDAPVGSLVFSVSSPNSNVGFAIASGNGLGLLVIDSQTGVVSVAVLPYQSSVVMNQSPMSIVVTATSPAGVSSSVTVLVQFVDNCLVNLCENDGVCIDRVDIYECSCMPGYEGTNCDILSTIIVGTDSQASTSSGVNSGTAAGVAIAVVAVVALVVLVAMFLLRRKHGKGGIAANSISTVYESADSTLVTAALLDQPMQSNAHA